jgi:hypothetical protein
MRDREICRSERGGKKGSSTREPSKLEDSEANSWRTALHWEGLESATPMSAAAIMSGSK